MTKPQWSGDFPAWGQFFQHKSKMNGDSVVFSNISVVENFFLRRWKTFDDFSDLCSVLWTERYLNTVENMSWEILGIYRGYYMVVRRYEFYVRVARAISHEWAQRTSEILFLPREHKIHIFEPTCNVLFILWRNQFYKSKRRESWRHWTIRHSQRWHTENTPLGSRMKWRMELIYEWFSSQ